MAVSRGHLELSAKLMDAAIKQGGLGFNFLHGDVSTYIWIQSFNSEVEIVWIIYLHVFEIKAFHSFPLINTFRFWTLPLKILSHLQVHLSGKNHKKMLWYVLIALFYRERKTRLMFFECTITITGTMLHEKSHY